MLPQETMNKGTTSKRCLYCGNDHFPASRENIKNVTEKKEHFTTWSSLSTLFESGP